MNRSVLIAALILAAIVAYFGVRSVLRGSLSTEAAPAARVTEQSVPKAVVIEKQSQVHVLHIHANGRTQPDRAVTIRSATAGTVVSTPVAEGRYVTEGTVLCGLDVEARNARLQEAEAARNAARIDFEAAASLAAKGLSPANREAAARANLDAAEAAVNAARVELARTQIQAPFDGVFERRLAETGDYLGPGGACGLLVDLDPVIVAAELTEAEAGRLQPGMTGEAVLADGRRFPAQLRFVALTANDQTRTFLVEAALETGDERVAAGISASLSVPAGEVRAVLLEPSLLTLSDAGHLGVRAVGAEDRVVFRPVTIIDETPGGAWVTGLDEEMVLVAKGQDYLAEGVRVEPVMLTEISP